MITQSVMDYILFRKMIMPVALQLLFWAGIAGSLYGVWWLYTHDNLAWTMALLFGPLVTRLIFESLILRYETYLRLVEISDNLKAGR